MSSTQCELFLPIKLCTMKNFCLRVVIPYLCGFIISLLAGTSCGAATIDDFRAAAEKANAQLTIPQWDQTPDAVTKSVKDAIAAANKRLDQVGAQDPKKVTFKSTIVALDDIA